MKIKLIIGSAERWGNNSSNFAEWMVDNELERGRGSESFSAPNCFPITPTFHRSSPGRRHLLRNTAFAASSSALVVQRWWWLERDAVPAENRSTVTVEHKATESARGQSQLEYCGRRCRGWSGWAREVGGRLHCEHLHEMDCEMWLHIRRDFSLDPVIVHGFIRSTFADGGLPPLWALLLLVVLGWMEDVPVLLPSGSSEQIKSAL